MEELRANIKMEKNKKVKQIIVKLGGVAQVAERLGIQRMAVQHWLTDGIPVRRWRWLIKQGVATWEELAKLYVEMQEEREKGKQ